MTPLYFANVIQVGDDWVTRWKKSELHYCMIRWCSGPILKTEWMSCWYIAQRKPKRKSCSKVICCHCLAIHWNSLWGIRGQKGGAQHATLAIHSKLDYLSDRLQFEFMIGNIYQKLIPRRLWLSLPSDDNCFLESHYLQMIFVQIYCFCRISFLKCIRRTFSEFLAVTFFQGSKKYY